MKKKLLYWLPVALGVLFLLSLAWLQRGRALSGGNDFAQLYTGAELAGPRLYSRAANLEAIESELGFTMETVVYTRPPFYAALLRPLALLPYRAAYALFSALTFACTLWFVIRFSKECPPLAFFAAMSIPVVTALCGGQDTPLLLATVGAAILLLRRKLDWIAGLALSLCAIKFHLFLFVPLLLIAKKRWRVLGGGAIGTAALTILGMVVDGPDSPRAYLAVLRDPWINPDAAAMPNLHGMAAALHLGAGIEWTLAALVAAAFVWMVARVRNFEFLLAASLVCGLLTSFHSGVADDVLLLPVFVLVVGNCANKALRAAAGLILTPIPYFLVLAEAPYSAFFAGALLAMLGLFLAAGQEVISQTAESEPVPAAELFV